MHSSLFHILQDIARKYGILYFRDHFCKHQATSVGTPNNPTRIPHNTCFIQTELLLLDYCWNLQFRICLNSSMCVIIKYININFFIYFADRASQYIYLNINQLDALNFIMSLFHASTSFEHMCLSSGSQNCTIQPLVSSQLYSTILNSWRWAHMLETCRDMK